MALLQSLLLMLALMASNALADTTTSTIPTAMMRGSTLEGFGLKDLELPSNHNALVIDEEEMMEREMYWSMKEMKRYNALRGAWPLREEEKHEEEEDTATPNVLEGCA